MSPLFQEEGLNLLCPGQAWDNVALDGTVSQVSPVRFRSQR